MTVHSDILLQLLWLLSKWVTFACTVLYPVMVNCRSEHHTCENAQSLTIIETHRMHSVFLKWKQQTWISFNIYIKTLRTQNTPFLLMSTRQKNHLSRLYLCLPWIYTLTIPPFFPPCSLSPCMHVPVYQMILRKYITFFLIAD